MQIFCDFSGYSTCAIGCALCFGFVLPDNFRAPYAAVGFTDFWRRWHISLSTWLRDYLYISLGGNRKGSMRTSLNLLITMLLGGLWHGASWNFIIWGGLHGVFLSGERILKAIMPASKIWSFWPVQMIMGAFTFLLVCIAWVFFRADNLEHATSMVQSMCGFHSSASHIHGAMLVKSDALLAGSVSAAVLTYQWSFRNKSIEQVAGVFPWWARSLILAMLGIALLITPGDDRAFIYFQF